ncbi:DUF7344 domain-containing protein [Halomarina rubra]|uniref:DUF7344 domain-containing protein n=1 Tax=Halomarina rubra TaxID=2071873 RepID=A0ABD6B075_9EURY|nr:hypothetical protein [Halomarina rubra]
MFPLTGYDPQSLSKDTAYDLMRHGSRRAVVRLLGTHPVEWQLDALATEIVADASRDSSGVGDDRRRRVLVDLVHHHLPKLAEANVVEFDHGAGVVAPGRHLPTLLPLA